MERVYSAFFTSERRRQDVQLTAAALAKHDKLQQQQQQQRPSSRQSSPERVVSANGSNVPRDDILEPKLRSEYSTSGVVVVEDDDLSPLDLAPRGGNDKRVDDEAEINAEDVAAHQREFALLVKQQASVQKDVVSALRAATRAFLLAYGAKAFTAVLLASRKWSRMEYGGYADAVRLLLRADTIRFGAFFGSLVGAFRLTELAARLARGKRDATNLAIAGGVSGLALLVDSESRRSTIALYIFVRMLDVVGRHLVAIGKLPSWQYSSEGLFAASNAFIMYAFLVDPTLLPKSYYNWILHMGAATHEGLDYIVRQGWRGELDFAGNAVAFRRCQPHYHLESCTTHAVTNWFGGLGRALQIYLPVHFLPALIFKFQRLKESPVSTAARITYAALCSSAFLTSYQATMKLTVCTMRNAFQHDYVAEAWLGGVMTGVSLFFEDPKRRFELMLYCLPRALDIVWQLLKRRGVVKYVRHSEVALFCLSMALIMSRPAEHFKPTYLRILRFLFGRGII